MQILVAERKTQRLHFKNQGEKRKKDSSALTNKFKLLSENTIHREMTSARIRTPCSRPPMRLLGAFLCCQATAVTVWFTHMTRFCKAIKRGLKPPEASNIYSSSLRAWRTNEVWWKFTKRQVSQDCTRINKIGVSPLLKLFAFLPKLS